VLTGNSEPFTAGADITEMAEASTVALMQRGIYLLLLTDIAQFPMPLIAAVNGFALGGGYELALYADTIIAGKQSTFGFSKVRLGILPGEGGTQRLLRAVGKYRAMRWLMTGERTAEEAFAMGMLSRKCVQCGGIAPYRLYGTYMMHILHGIPPHEQLESSATPPWPVQAGT
tara:strand:+ start:33313 stop:33828 length:516 start_codon:yes stop_codon:yes gene_type:complete